MIPEMIPILLAQVYFEDQAAGMMRETVSPYYASYQMTREEDGG